MSVILLEANILVDPKPFSDWLQLISWLALARVLQLKHTPGLFQGKPATSGGCFSFPVTHLGSLVLLTTFSAEPYPFHKRQSRSNIVLVLGPPSPDQIFRGKMIRADHFSWNFGPPDQFFRRTKISVIVQAQLKVDQGTLFSQSNFYVTGFSFASRCYRYRRRSSRLDANRGS